MIFLKLFYIHWYCAHTKNHGLYVLDVRQLNSSQNSPSRPTVCPHGLYMSCICTVYSTWTVYVMSYNPGGRIEQWTLLFLKISLSLRTLINLLMPHTMGREDNPSMQPPNVIWHDTFFKKLHFILFSLNAVFQKLMLVISASCLWIKPVSTEYTTSYLYTTFSVRQPCSNGSCILTTTALWKTWWWDTTCISAFSCYWLWINLLIMPWLPYFCQKQTHQNNSAARLLAPRSHKFFIPHVSRLFN